MSAIPYPLDEGRDVTAIKTRTYSWARFAHDWVLTVDHKQLGMMYIIIALLFFVLSGLQAAAIRAQLMYPNNGLVTPQTFNRMFTMHGTTMVFFVGMPFIAG